MWAILQRARTAASYSSARHAQALLGYLLIAALGAGYLVLALAIPSGTFFSQDSDAKFLQARALAASAWRSDGIADPARAADPSGALSPLRPDFAGHFFYYRDGQWHSKYSLPFALLASIPYQLFGLRGLVLVSALPAGLCLLLMLYAAHQLQLRRPWLAILLFGACTPLLFYAVEFWEHTLGLMLAMVVLLCVIREQPLRPANMALCGLAIGVGMWFRTELICMVPAVGLALLWPLRRDHLRAGIVFGLALALSMLPQIMTNWLYTDSLIGPQLGAELQVQARGRGLWPAIQSQASVAWLMLSPSRFKTGWLILLPLTLAVTLVVWRRRGRAAALAWLAFLLLASTCAALLWGLRSTSIYNYPIDLLSAGGGIALAPLCLRYRPRERRQQVQIVRLVVFGAVFAGLVLATSPHFGGQQWGPRYLLPVYPALILLGAIGLEGLLASSGPARARLLLASRLLVVLSLGVSLQSIGYVVIWRELHQSTVTRLATLPPTIVVTDMHVLPFTIASVLDRHTLLGVESAEQVQQMAGLLERQGYRDLLWVSTNRPFAHNWQDVPLPPDLYRELERLGWVASAERTVDRGGYIYTHYRLPPRPGGAGAAADG